MQINTKLTTAMQPITICLVDDDLDYVNLILHFMNQSPTNWEIKTYFSGSEMLTHLRHTSYDCILLDHALPDMTGLELLRDIQPHLKASPIAVVYITNFGDEEVATQALQQGAHDYIAKHKLNSQRLQQSIHTAVDKARENHRQQRYQMQLEENNIVLEAHNRLLEQMLLNRSRDLQQTMERFQHEIYQHEQTQQRLYQSQHRYEQLLQQTQEGIWIIDMNGQTIMANQSMALMLGLTDITKLSFYTFWHIANAEQEFRPFLNSLIASGHHQLVWLRTADSMLMKGFLKASLCEPNHTSAPEILLTFSPINREAMFWLS